jgi:hypothetical protein
MKNLKILAVFLLLIASGIAYSGGKEYTYKNCDKGKNNCDESKDSGKKISFKVSKSLGSVMRTFTRNDGYSKSYTIDNCKVFDDETFECKSITEPVFGDGWFVGGRSDIWILSNGKWEHTIEKEGNDVPGRDISKGTYSCECGTEIKSLLNLFK